MPFSKILHKRSLSAGAIPASGAIDVGEIALNAADGKIFTKTTAGVVKHFTDDSSQPYTLNDSLSSSYFNRGSNQVTGVFSTVINGINNVVAGAGTTIANGEQNTNNADYSFIGSGTDNIVSSAADFGAILAGQNNTLQHQNSFILGSNVTTHAENFTYVQNLSVLGDLYVGGSNVNGGGGGSSEWDSITNKPTTLSGYGITDAAPISLVTFVSSNSANWDSTRTTVNTNSAKWENTYTNVNTNSASWNSTRTTVNSNSAKWESTYTNVNSNSAKWESTYTNVNSNSGSYATQTYVKNNFLPLTGGLVSNGLSAEHLLALSSFAAIGYGTIADPPTLYVGVSVVGVNTELPNAALTVIGDISATGNIYGSDTDSWNGTYTTVNSNSAEWENTYTTVNTNSANWNSTRTTVNSNSANWNSTRTTVNSNSAKWENVYTNVNTNSADWSGVYSSYSSASSTYLTNSSIQNKFLPLSGGTVTGNVTAVKFYGDGSELTGIVAGDTEATTLVRTNSSNWDGVYTTYSGASSSYATKEYTHTNFLPLSGGTLTGSLTGNNVLLTGTLKINGSGNGTTTLYIASGNKVGVNTESPNQALTVSGNVSASGILYGDNMEIGGTNQPTTVFVGSSSVGINTESPLATLDVSGNNIRISETKTPAGSGANGVQGEICWDSDYLYVCIAANTWKRTALQSW